MQREVTPTTGICEVLLDKRALAGWNFHFGLFPFLSVGFHSKLLCLLRIQTKLKYRG